MLSTFNALKPFIKVRSQYVTIDNFAFKFHYRGTFLLLLVSTVLVTSSFYTNLMKCIVHKDSVPEHVVNTYCFFTSTFTVVRHFNETLLRHGWQALAHPGVDNMHPGDEKKHHAYYQWVSFLLFGQALSFYIPHFLWRTWEGGRNKALVDGLQMAALSKYNQKKEKLSGNREIQTIDSIKMRIQLTTTYFYKHIKINEYFATRMILCELLNFINLILQIHLTNLFLGGQFYSLGFEFINDDFLGQMDILDFVFPKVTKCHFHKYSPSGSIQLHDALCIMALNIINEKIYVFLWFWYWIMIAVTVGSSVWRFISMILFRRSMRFNRFVFASACPGRLNTRHMSTVINHISFSDWVFLHYLAKNMEPFVFCELLADLSAEFRKSDAYESDTTRIDDIDNTK